MGPDLVDILDFLNRTKIRATYGAVADVIGGIPQGVGAKLGPRSPYASWIVNKESGEPSGYMDAEKHPDLYSSPHVLTTGDELLQEMKEDRRE